MSIVSAAELHDRMGGPDWTPEQRRDAEALLVQLEAKLQAALGTRISPGVERIERAPVSEAGVIVTDHPVAEVVSIDGREVTLDADGATVLPSGWALIDHRVRRTTMGSVAAEVAFPSPAIYDTSALYPPAGSGLSGMLTGLRPDPDLQYVALNYRPGWGPDDALRQSILTKAKAIMVNNHDNTITARGLEASKPTTVPEEWTTDELAQLASFRDMPGPMSTRW